MKVNQPYFAYFALTAELAAPPRLLFTVTFAGFTGQENAPVYLPPPLLVSVPIAAPVDVTDTVSVALVLVLVAWRSVICGRIAVEVPDTWGRRSVRKTSVRTHACGQIPAEWASRKLTKVSETCPPSKPGARFSRPGLRKTRRRPGGVERRVETCFFEADGLTGLDPCTRGESFVAYIAGYRNLYPGLNCLI